MAGSKLAPTTRPQSGPMSGRTLAPPSGLGSGPTSTAGSAASQQHQCHKFNLQRHVTLKRGWSMRELLCVRMAKLEATCNLWANELVRCNHAALMGVSSGACMPLRGLTVVCAVVQLHAALTHQTQLGRRLRLRCCWPVCRSTQLAVAGCVWPHCIRSCCHLLCRQVCCSGSDGKCIGGRGSSSLHRGRGRLSGSGPLAGAAQLRGRLLKQVPQLREHRGAAGLPQEHPLQESA